MALSPLSSVTSGGLASVAPPSPTPVDRISAFANAAAAAAVAPSTPTLSLQPSTFTAIGSQRTLLTTLFEALFRGEINNAQQASLSLSVPAVEQLLSGAVDGSLPNALTLQETNAVALTSTLASLFSTIQLLGTENAPQPTGTLFDQLV